MKEAIRISIQGGQMIKNFIHVLSAHKGLSPKTLKEYASDLRHFIAWFETADHSGEGMTFRIEDVATPTLIRYREAMLGTMQLKPATINRRLVALKRFFEWAVSEAKLNRDPSKPVKLVPEEKASPRQMTDQEEAALIAATERYGSLRDRTIVSVMLNTGLRPMEVCDLTPGDIQISECGSYLTVRSGKRIKLREVPLNAACRAALDNYLATLSPDASYLFPSEKTGTRLTERALRHLIQKYMKAAGIEGLRAHDLRHRFGYVMAANTALHRLSQIMGHDNLNSTKIYVKEALNFSSKK
ncbi:Tyrosine recombinase XerC [Paenibacillus konkukensis]|uniref:Tyrosine recombinase XerC n=1 Tax=Paenibacillus konkukensis TaxID=2020716 RepID=A0ABY4RNE6_9BACL|nr:tyrosine-type recombinase/integrase [Paenibacillus konkukensis]UQZ83485.1 Tyrosine recombinase XerC [Paenibacillus konkukensis]